jgi:pantetheine-phosphate adenylyltransferase
MLIGCLTKLLGVDDMLAPIPVLYAFSADPITYGHINIVERIVNTFGGCLVAIGRNPLKKYLFSVDERRHLVEQALMHIPNVSVMSFDGMVVDFAREQGARLIIKGVRNAADMDYEQILHQVGVSQRLGIETHVLFAEQHLAHVSSSVVKAMQEHGAIQDYVPLVVKAALEARISGQVIIGITGHIASGKSTLAQKFVAEAAQLGIPVHHLDMDKLGHELLAGQVVAEPLYRELCKNLCTLMGEQIMVEGILSRRKIGSLIFSQPLLREQFNACIAQPMAIVMRKKLKALRGVILVDGALLADLQLLHLCNYRCVLCHVDPQVQRERMLARGYDEAELQARLLAQWDTFEKRQHINTGIARQGFGQLWETSAEFGATLSLASVLASCEETKWLL